MKRFLWGLGAAVLLCAVFFRAFWAEEPPDVMGDISSHIPPKFEQPFPGGEGWDRMYFGKSGRQPTVSQLMSFAKKEANLKTVARFFEDDLFIGDSRTVGLGFYSGMDTADYFSATGMSVFNITTSTVRIKGESFTLERLLSEKTYNRIFVMLGINELALDIEEITDKYAALLDMIMEAQPKAEIYVQLNMRVTVDRSAVDPSFNNTRIDKLNENISILAEKRHIGVLDVNGLFDDGHGNLSAKYTFDHTHIIGRYYKAWAAWMYLELSP